MAHETIELVLPQFTLHPAAHRSGAERKACDFYAGFAERYPIGGLAASGRGLQKGNRSCARERSGGSEGSLQEIASGTLCHVRPPIGAIVSRCAVGSHPIVRPDR